MRRNLKTLRVQNGFTINEMAARIGVSARMYQFYEAGGRNPSYKVMNKLEDMFQLPHRELLKVENAC